MTYFAFCLYLMRGPVAPEQLPETITAEYLFCALERSSGLSVTRADPELDRVMVTFRDKREFSASLTKLVLRAHGIYVHLRVLRDGSQEYFASRSKTRPPKEGKRLYVRVFSPRHVQPEELVTRLKESAGPEGPAIVLEPRTGKIVLKAEEQKLVTDALTFLRKEDRASAPLLGAHLFRCDGIFVQDAHRELLRLLSPEVRRRVVIVPYKRGNTLIISCGTDDWKIVLEALRTVNPKGEVQERTR